jgi:hypothetical protein
MMAAKRGFLSLRRTVQAMPALLNGRRNGFLRYAIRGTLAA